MIVNGLLGAGRVLSAMLLVALGATGTLYADDTEIYQIYGGRPKVLIVIDDSGSMSTVLEGSTRMEIVQDVITDLIADNTDIDFGLMEFNSNTEGENYHGGRIISRITADMTEEQRTDMIGLLDSISAGGSTPLCESYYEAYQYLTGGAVVYGDLWQRDNPARDALDGTVWQKTRNLLTNRLHPSAGPCSSSYLPTASHRMTPMPMSGSKP